MSLFLFVFFILVLDAAVTLFLALDVVFGDRYGRIESLVSFFFLNGLGSFCGYQQVWWCGKRVRWGALNKERKKESRSLFGGRA